MERRDGRVRREVQIMVAEEDGEVEMKSNLKQ